MEFACDMAEKLTDSREPNACKAEVYTSLALANDSQQKFPEDALKYTKKAKEFDGLKEIMCEKLECEKLEKILSNRNEIVDN